MDERQRTLSRSRSGPSNPMRVGFEAAQAAIMEAAQRAMANARVERDAIAGICAGLGGVGRLEAAVQIRAAIAAAFPRTAVKVCSDLELALSAIESGPAIVLVVGTGSAAIGRDAQGLVLRAGGHGPLLGDEGSAYDVGRRAVIAAIREHERTGADSALGKQILAQLGSPGWVTVHQRARGRAAPE